jgi:hypothetical protein
VTKEVTLILELPSGGKEKLDAVLETSLTTRAHVTIPKASFARFAGAIAQEIDRQKKGR